MPDETRAPNVSTLKGSNRTKLTDLLNDRIEIATLEAELKQRKEENTVAVAAILDKLNMKAVEHNGWVATRVDGVNKNLNRALLLDAGVGADVIESCYKVTHYVTVSMRKLSKEDE